MTRTDATTPRIQKIIAELTAAAKPSSTGERYIRASEARRIIGLTDTHAAGWVTRGRIKPMRLRVRRCKAAPFGLVSAWPLDQTILCAQRYRANWSQHEDDVLLKNLGRRPTDWIARKLGRTDRAVRHRATHLGVNKYNAQGLLTTGDVAGLCRRTRQAVNRWCHDLRPPLCYSRLTFGKREKMIDIKHLVHFLDTHPDIKRGLPKASHEAIRRMTSTRSGGRVAA